MDISIDERTCLNIKEALRLEWLDTNGRGGYSSSTILQCHTRKYHGLLVSELAEPPGRYVLLSKLEDSILVKNQEFFLSFHRYPGLFYPYGHKYLTGFHLRNGHPHFTYKIGDISIHKSIMMIRGEERVLIRYFCEKSEFPLILRVKPLLAFRHFHALMKENIFLRVKTYEAKNGFKIQPYDDMPPFFIQTSRRSEFYPSPLWYYNFEYIVEAERGYESREDLFQPGVFEIALKEKDIVLLSASAKEVRGALKSDWGREEARRRGEAAADERLDEARRVQRKGMAAELVSAARHFPIRTVAGREDIVAGYHWFSCWGRDSMISLPGLTLWLGRHEQAIKILKSFSKHEKKGLLPNFISDKGESAYNSVDTSLWYIWAIQQLASATGDYGTVEKEFWPVIKNIISWYRKGTDFKIRMHENCLIYAGDETTQLTWMDAIAEGRPVTPRSGFAVEINALWYNALCFAEELAGRFGDKGFSSSGLIKTARQSFHEIFWVDDGNYLGDVCNNGVLDRAVRPNQLFAVSLPHAVLDQTRWQGVVERVAKELLTPCGLRTLSPKDPAYCGRYGGDSAARDKAYHQGTVWPWLLGPFGEACLKSVDDKKTATKFLFDLVKKFLDGHLNKEGIGFISEVFNGDPPHEAGGCIAQSWSVAEIIRLLKMLKAI